MMEHLSHQVTTGFLRPCPNRRRTNAKRGLRGCRRTQVVISSGWRVYQFRHGGVPQVESEEVERWMLDEQKLLHTEKKPIHDANSAGQLTEEPPVEGQWPMPGS